MAALRWGICSAGKISHDFVVGIKTLPSTSHSIVAVAARSLDSAQSFDFRRQTPLPFLLFPVAGRESGVRKCSRKQSDYRIHVDLNLREMCRGELA